MFILNLLIKNPNKTKESFLIQFQLIILKLIFEKKNL